MRYSDYQIVRAGDSNELQTKVRAAVADGWSPHGGLIYDGRHLMQALTLDLQPADEMRIEAEKQLNGVTPDNAVDVLAALQSSSADAGAGQAQVAAEPVQVESPAPVAAPAPAAKISAKATKS